MIFAAIVSGYMTVFMGGQVVMQPKHGAGDNRDCGTHRFKPDDGTEIIVVVKCDARVRDR